MEHCEDRKTSELLSERVCREAIECSLLASVAAIDLEGRLVFVNPAFCRMTGWSAEELLGQKLPYPFCTPGEMEAVKGAWKTILEEREEAGVFELAFRRRNGERFFVLIQVSTIKDAEGRLKGWMGLLTDITERKRAEEAILAERNFRRAIERSLLVGLAAIDLEGRYLHVNDAFCAMTGCSKKEFFGMSPPYGFWPPEKMEFFKADFAKALAAGHVPGVMELKFRRRTGGCFDVLMHASPLKDAHGTVQGCVASFTDITAWKEAQAALRESEERFRSLVEHALVGFFILQEGEVVFLNPAQEKLFGAVRVPFPLAVLEGSVHPEDKKKFRECREALGAGRTVGREAEMRFYPRGTEPSGRTLRWVHCRMTPIVFRGKEAVLVNMVDVTQLKEMERIALIQEKMVSLGHVATGIAHEIRNPLSGLNLYLSSLEKVLEEAEGLEEEAREAAGTIVEMALSASQKIEGVIRRVMDFASPAPPKLVPLCVNHCVKEALHLSQVALRKTGIRVEVSLQEDLPPCRGDARLLEQVLLNLLTNAAQVMEQREGKKRIEVTSRVEGGHVIFTVADSGPGVPAGLREKIFDPFFTTKQEGTGIGLSITHKIVSDHGGFLTVGTSKWGGALFTVGLPPGEAGTTAGSRNDQPLFSAES
jgi:PAS domain S-box-containing protein